MFPIWNGCVPPIIIVLSLLQSVGFKGIKNVAN